MKFPKITYWDSLTFYNAKANHIDTPVVYSVAYDFCVIWKKVIAPQGLTIGPAGLEPPEGARIRWKATVIIWRNPLCHQTDEDQKSLPNPKARMILTP